PAPPPDATPLSLRVALPTSKLVSAGPTAQEITRPTCRCRGGFEQRGPLDVAAEPRRQPHLPPGALRTLTHARELRKPGDKACQPDRKSTRLNSSHVKISYAV